jgi:hypothetical protein
MIDIIEALSEDQEYMDRFCQDCPARRQIPATLETPAEDICPADFEPFYNEGCVRPAASIIKASVRDIEIEMAWAVA